MIFVLARIDVPVKERLAPRPDEISGVPPLETRETSAVDDTEYTTPFKPVISGVEMIKDPVEFNEPEALARTPPVAERFVFL